MVHTQLRFNWVPEKVPVKVWEALVQRQVRFNRVPEKVPEKVWEALEHAEVFPALGFAARFRKICKNKTLRLRLLGMPPKLIWFPAFLVSWFPGLFVSRGSSFWAS